MSTLDPPWSVDLKCGVVVHEDNGTDKSYLTDPAGIIDGEIVVSSLMRSRGRLGKGKFYKVTFEEIPAFGT